MNLKTVGCNVYSYILISVHTLEWDPTFSLYLEILRRKKPISYRMLSASLLFGHISAIAKFDNLTSLSFKTKGVDVNKRTVTTHTYS